MLQDDLKNERKHLAFYMHSAVMMQGLHREELREFCESEAKGEFDHVLQFSEAIVHLGGVPDHITNQFPLMYCHPQEILKYARDMEEEVANIYAHRLRMTHEMENAATAYVHVFYENQIEDSWKTSREIDQMLKGEEPVILSRTSNAD